ncbi:hypothetical protein Belba_0858 [Belliella baltica DSM 15883]|uniref:Membrane or secreted protein n=1 Tax=Belliella baltica (strain DSM 15883 / CIP 108006 / LMG 21964 / BA134) TaxID=866536 RepID=I3Z2N7_BELBD|nr:hypothetical protein [Belliella baltica]AFL83505.1 hypothetical protein Belba_0858 [Belliella baltica DSM 15883]
MKKILFLPLLFMIGTLLGQNLEGAWKLTHQNGKEIKDKTFIKIYQDGYFSFGAKETDTNKFIGAGGGEFTLKDNYYTEMYDFYTSDTERVGTTTEFSLDIVDSKIVISTEKGGSAMVEIWEKVSDAKDDLTRNWVITGRKRGEEISRSTPGARRTIKILSGGHFQWVAFNSETKEFSGTGGGTYAAENGKYVENIQFFSRDDSRVGASLEFNYEVIDGEWHHSGMSSTGNPIYEIWTKYTDAYTKPK